MEIGTTRTSPRLILGTALLLSAIMIGCAAADRAASIGSAASAQGVDQINVDRTGLAIRGYDPAPARRC